MVCLACPGPCHICDCAKGRTRSGVKLVSLCDTNAMAAMAAVCSSEVVHLFGVLVGRKDDMVTMADYYGFLGY